MSDFLNIQIQIFSIPLLILLGLILAWLMRYVINILKSVSFLKNTSFINQRFLALFQLLVWLLFTFYAIDKVFIGQGLRFLLAALVVIYGFHFLFTNVLKTALTNQITTIEADVTAKKNTTAIDTQKLSYRMTATKKSLQLTPELIQTGIYQLPWWPVGLHPNVQINSHHNETIVEVELSSATETQIDRLDKMLNEFFEEQHWQLS